MASPKFELQLGHLCNNRCVFCISGFRTSKGMVSLLPIEALWAEVEAAHRRGSRSITFLGGEPTVQPSFLELLRRTAALGFDEIVLFTNGSRLYRP
ncbi:MAG: radical SAM protein, partial [Myxococcales bacterium]|nr:radical SAM protein [Myxococcales bacterium]